MQDFFSQHILLVPCIAFLISVICKSGYLFFRKNFSIKRALWTGGMPSVHSALVTSITTAIGIQYGIQEPLFAACLIFSLIIIYDAINLRFQTGLHARMLNTIGSNEDKLNESLGHLPGEAFVGSLIGIGVAVILMIG